MLDTAYRTPVGLLAVPMRYGMTLGELARLARADLGLDDRPRRRAGGRLAARRCRSTRPGLPFVPPSPNLRSLESLYHYPGLCLFEGTNLSVGRGSEAPFEQIGAPWLDTAAVLARVRAAALPGSIRRGDVHAQSPGRRQVCRHAACRHPASGHRPRRLRPDGHRGASPGSGPRGPRRPVRLDPDAFRPAGRWGGAAGADRSGDRRRRRSFGGWGSDRRRSSETSASAVCSIPNSSSRPCRASVSDCPNQFC